MPSLSFGALVSAVVRFLSSATCFTLMAFLGLTTGAARGQTCTGGWVGLPGNPIGPDFDVDCMVSWDPDGSGPQTPLVVVGGWISCLSDDPWSGDCLLEVNSIAAFDPLTGQWSAFGSGMDGPVWSLGVWNGSLIAGGSFTTAGGRPAAGIARWDGGSWQPLGAGVDGDVYALTVHNGNLVAGGIFTTAGGVACRNIARWNGSVWSALSSGLRGGTDPAVHALIVRPSTNELVAGGQFSLAGAVSVNNIARWNGTAWSGLLSGMTGVAGDTDVGVYALAIGSTGRVQAGGRFTTAGGVSCRNIASWNGTAWSSFGAGLYNDPNPEDDLGIVHSLAVRPNGAVVAGGEFFFAGDVEANSIASWQDGAWSEMPPAMPVRDDLLPSAVRSLLATGDGDVFAGGYFPPVGDEFNVDFFAIHSQLPPTIVASPTSGQLCIDGEFRLAVTARRAVSYQWRRNGIDLPLETDPVLDLSPWFEEDAGNYDCVVTNDCGSATSATATITFRLPPTSVGIVHENAPVCPRGRAILRAVPSGGTAPFSFQWLRTGPGGIEPIAGATEATLAVDPAPLDDAFLYSCVVASNGCPHSAEESDFADISFWEPPSGVSVAQTSAPACSSQPVTMTATTVGGTSPLTFQWQRSITPGAPWVDIAGATGATYQAPSAQPGDSFYRCLVASNGCRASEAASNAIQLSFTAAPAITSQPAASQTRCPGNPATFTVAATGTSLTYQWRKNGVDIAGATAATYRISAVVVGDAGIYSCRVSNACGNQISSDASLALWLPPTSVSVAQTSAPACSSQPVTMTATTVGGTSPLTYQWQSSITPGAPWVDIAGATGSTYQVPSAQSAASFYRCLVASNGCRASEEASNALAVASRTAPSTVTASSNVSLPACSGSTVRITASPIGGDGPFDFQWRRDGVDIQNATSASIDVTTAGSYTCVVKPNGCTGPSTPSNAIQLNFTTAPVITNQPSSGTGWSSLGTGAVNGMNSAVYATAVLNGDLVAGGQFWQAGGRPLNGIARWNGSSWVEFSPGVPDVRGSNPVIMTMTIRRNGQLVVAGYFEGIGGITCNRIATWNGTTWLPLGSGINGPVFAVAELPNGDLVAGGLFTQAGGVACNNIARWNGSIWSPLAGGITGITDPTNQRGVRALAVLANGDLVAGGDFTTAGGVACNNIARWNGSSWSPLGSGLNQGAGGWVNALTVRPNGELVVAGLFVSAGGQPNTSKIARWNGTVWSSMGFGLNEAVWSLIALPNGDVVAGGGFTGAYDTAAANTTIPCGGLAYWNGSSWAAMGAPADRNVLTLTASSGGEIVAGGDFTSIGGEVRNRIASRRWSVCPGTPTTLSIVATGSSPTFQWRKNGVNLSNGGGISGVTSPTLSFASVTANDAASYDCVVASTCGSVASATATLWVGSGIPVITSQPEDQGACVGAPATFQVSATGSVWYQWRKNGVAIPGATAATYTISAVAAGDAGPYDCVVTADCGTTTSRQAQLSVCACRSCPADFNEDGGVDGGDIEIFFASWEIGACEADVNQDGGVDGGDVAEFIIRWEGGGC
jgi:hypothetical protein